MPRNTIGSTALRSPTSAATGRPPTLSAIRSNNARAAVAGFVTTNRMPRRSSRVTGSARPVSGGVTSRNSSSRRWWATRP